MMGIIIIVLGLCLAAAGYPSLGLIVIAIGLLVLAVWA